MKSQIKFLLVCYVLFFISPMYAQNIDWLSQISDQTLNQLPSTNNKTYYTASTSDDTYLYNAGVLKLPSNEKRLIVSKYLHNNPIPIWEKIINVSNLGTPTFVYDIAISRTTNNLTVVGETDQNSMIVRVDKSNGSTLGVNRIFCDLCNVTAIENSPTGTPIEKRFIAGRFVGEIRFNYQNIYTSSHAIKSDIFIARYSPLGVFEEVSIIQSNGGDLIYDLAIDNINSVWASISTTGRTYLDGNQISIQGLNNQLSYKIIKLNSNLTYQNGRQIGSRHLYSDRNIRDSHENWIDIPSKCKIDLNFDYSTLIYGCNLIVSNQPNSSYDCYLGKMNSLTGQSISYRPIKMVASTGPWFKDLVINDCNKICVLSDFNSQSSYHQENINSFTTNRIGIYENSQLNNSTSFLSSTLNFDCPNSNLYSIAKSNNFIGFCGVYNDVQVYFNQLEPVLPSLNNYQTGNLPLAFCGSLYTGEEVINNNPSSTILEVLCSGSFPLTIPFSSCTNPQLSIFDGNAQPVNNITYQITSNSFMIQEPNFIGELSFHVSCEDACNRTIMIHTSTIVDELEPEIVNLTVKDENGIVTVLAEGLDLNLSNVVYMWQLYEGEINSNNEIQILNIQLGTDQPIAQEFDDPATAQVIEFVHTNLLNIPYVLKLGVYYKTPPEHGSCQWYEIRKGFWIQE